MWQTELTTIVRALLLDLQSVAYSDETLEELIVVAAQLVYGDLRLTNYTADIEGVELTPDPTVRIDGTRNDSLINLICFRAACIVDRGETAKAAKAAIIVKSGPSSYDLTNAAKYKLQLLDKGYCAVYQDTLLEYKTNKLSEAGAAIMTPFRLYAYHYGTY